MLRLLHVEDNDDDAFLVELALDQEVPRWRSRTAYLRVRTVEEAISEITEHRPHLMLLDLSLGMERGHQLLSHLKCQPETRRIPVVVLSNSDDPIDVARCYAHYAAAYLVKPESFAGLRSAMAALDGFWLRAATLPP